MTWFFAFLIVVVMGVVAVVASGRGGSMAQTYDDRPDSRVQADGPLTAADLRSVRFSTAFRGYRMSEVDSLLDRLAAEMTPVPLAGAEEAAPAGAEAGAEVDAPAGAEVGAAEPAGEAGAEAGAEPTVAPGVRYAGPTVGAGQDGHAERAGSRHPDSLQPDDGRR
jgi:DivIVA domain-containing protein